MLLVSISEGDSCLHFRGRIHDERVVEAVGAELHGPADGEAVGAELQGRPADVEADGAELHGPADGEADDEERGRRAIRGRRGKRKRVQPVTKHPMLPACNCKRKCSEKITEVRRKEIHEQFWAMAYHPRKYSFMQT